MLIPSHPQTMNRSPTLVPCALFHPFTSFDCTSHWSASAAAGSSFYMAFQGAQVIDQMARLKATCVPLARFQLPIVTMGVKTMEYHTNLQQAARDDPLIPDCQNYVMCIPESVSCLKASLQSNCSGSLNRNDQRIYIQLIWSNQDMLTTDNHSLFSVPLLILTTHKLSTFRERGRAFAWSQ